MTSTASKSEPVRLRSAYRDGSLVVVRRGDDLSAVCLKCGGASDGLRMRRRLGGPSSSTGRNTDAGSAEGILGIILLVITVIQLLFYIAIAIISIGEWWQRIVYVGLCDEHRRLHRARRRMAIVSVGLAVGVMVLGGVILTQPLHTTAVQIGASIACGIAILVGFGMAMWARAYASLSVRREVDDQLWIAGFGPGFIDRLSSGIANSPEK